jgi:GMP synthase (glutamine-hydrolysing)
LTERVLIVDFGSQFTQLIARRVREIGVFSEVVPCGNAGAAMAAARPQAIILSGGPASVTATASPRVPRALLEAGVPVLGICYGEQAMVAALGGAVEAADAREYGRAEIEIVGACRLFEELFPVGHREPVWMSHGDRVASLPQGFRAVAVSVNAPFAAIADDERRLYGVQFHPEVAHTPRGTALLESFLRRVAGCRETWSMASFRSEAIAAIRAQVGKAHVICGLSGGVDSAVTALLVHEAVGDQLTCVLVDTGLMRANEAEDVASLFRGHFNIPLVKVDAQDIFLDKLSGVVDPEDKRKIIGRTFIDIFEREARKLGKVEFLAQGTLYPDVIESRSALGGPSATIKSHHNVGGLPERMKLGLVEPLRMLFKDEVRALGRALGLSETFVGRHPFPGPGLAIRVPGEVTRHKLSLLRKADAIFIDEIRKAGLYDEIWQAFVVLLPVRSVGVMGDERTYDHVCALRAVTSQDGMTADSYDFSHAFLARTATRIVNEVRGINRVVYDVTSKPPGTIEWE